MGISRKSKEERYKADEKDIAGYVINMHACDIDGMWR